jgi:prevent-host-death family protein
MRIQMNIAEAKAKLSSLVQKALDGEEVIIARDGVPAVRIVALEAEAKPRRRPGILKEYGWTGPPTPYEVFEPEPEDAVESPLFPGDTTS